MIADFKQTMSQQYNNKYGFAMLFVFSFTKYIFVLFILLFSLYISKYK